MAVPAACMSVGQKKRRRPLNSSRFRPFAKIPAERGSGAAAAPGELIELSKSSYSHQQVRLGRCAPTLATALPPAPLDAKTRHRGVKRRRQFSYTFEPWQIDSAGSMGAPAPRGSGPMFPIGAASVSGRSGIGPARCVADPGSTWIVPRTSGRRAGADFWGDAVSICGRGWVGLVPICSEDAGDILGPPQYIQSTSGPQPGQN